MNAKAHSALTLPLPRLGLGTWRMGESRARRPAEVAAVRRALEIGYRMIDSAEMYGEGGAEEVVGIAVAEALRAGDVRRDELTIVSKVYPHNASRRGTLQACERSCQRLRVETIDLYLLHWRGQHALADTVAGMQALVAQGRIRHWGVSNFDVEDLRELSAVDSTTACAANQVWFSLGERGAEFGLLPWLRDHGMPMMAYSPIDQGRLSTQRALADIAAPLGLSAAQLALAWVMAQPGVVAIAKAVQDDHLRDNWVAAQAVLSAETLTQLNALYPPPLRLGALAMN